MEIKPLPGQHIVTVSVHNYSKASVREKYALLLFDFLSKLQYTDLNHIVVIAGDFNFDISVYEDQYPFLQPYLDSYQISKYKLTDLRRGLRRTSQRIDFVMVTKNHIKFDITLKNEKAHDLQVPEEVEDQLGGPEGHSRITNHNPVSAVVELNQTKCQLWLTKTLYLLKSIHSQFDNSS